MLDTGSTMGATIMNPDFVTNIRVAKKPIRMQTNAGSKVVTLEADVAGIGTAYYDPTQVANIFGYAHMADKYSVTSSRASSKSKLEIELETEVTQMKSLLAQQMEKFDCL